MAEINNLINDSTEKLLHIIKYITDVIIEVDLDGIFTYISPQVYDMFGYYPNELIGRKFFSYIHPNDMEVIMSNFEKAIVGKEIISIEYRAKHKKGHYIPVSAIGSLVSKKHKAKLIGVLRDITEKKLAEQKLKESEEKFKEITEQSLMGICIIQDSAIKYINKRITQMLGYSTEEIKNWSMNEFLNVVHPEDRNIAIDRLRRRLQGLFVKRPSQVYRLFTKKGEMKWMEIYSKFINYQGKDAILATLVDVSERRETELELEKERKKAESYLDIAGVIIIALDNHGEITLINKKGCEVLEYKEEELIGKNWFSTCIPNSIKDEIYNAFKKIMNGDIGLTKFYENPVKTKSGLEKIISWHNTLLYDNDGNIIGTLSSGNDITERKIADQILKQSEEKYRNLFETSPSAILLIDLKGEILDCNLTTEFLFGYSKEELIGMKFLNLDIYDHDAIQKVSEKFNLLVKGEEIHNFEIQLKKKDGNLAWIIVRASLIKTKSQALIQVIVHDITERKIIEQELRKISQLKTELLERTSHELKTPLISIKGFTDLLLELYKEKFDDNIISILSEIKSGTERLQSLINNLLVSSHLESGKVKFKPIKEDLAFLIRFCVKDLHALARIRNLFIQLDVPERLILEFEKERIYEVISSLLINSIKYTPPYGEIKIKTEIKDDFVIVSVEDNGIGFTEDEKLKLFKQFGKIERYGQGWDIGVEGTGMGLHISKKIVELHGGEIWVESEGRNKGAKVSFSLPFFEE